MLSEELGEVYDSYNNSEKDRYVCVVLRESVEFTTALIERNKQSRWQMCSESKNFGVTSTSRIDPMATLKQSEVSCH